METRGIEPRPAACKAAVLPLSLCPQMRARRRQSNAPITYWASLRRELITQRGPFAGSGPVPHVLVDYVSDSGPTKKAALAGRLRRLDLCVEVLTTKPPLAGFASQRSRATHHDSRARKVTRSCDPSAIWRTVRTSCDTRYTSHRRRQVIFVGGSDRVRASASFGTPE